MSQILPTCPNCNAPISVNAKFCRECGKPIEIAEQEPTPSPSPTLASTQATCPHCGALISPTAKFCRECGSTIEPQKPVQAPQPVPPGETSCPHCGAVISSTAKFCKTCGNAIAASIAATSAAAISTKEPAPNTSPFAPTEPPRTQPKSPPPVKRAKSKKPLLLMGCVAIPLLCLLVLGGGYFAFRSGAITQKTLLNLAGIGPGALTLMNFRDDAIQVTVTGLGESQQTETPTTGEDELLDAYAISNRELSQGKYRVEIRRQDDGTLLGEACTLTMRAGDQYRFVALRNGIMVDRKNSPSSKTEDLIPDTSTFCR